MKNNNKLLREIAEEVNDDLPDEIKSDNFWLHKIAEGISDINPEIIIDGDNIDLADYVKKADITTEELVFTYEDESTETIKFLVDNSGD